MAYIQYLAIDGVPLPLPDSYEVQMADVEADSGGETEAGTTQRDVVRMGVVSIPAAFSVSPKWLKLLTGFKQMEKPRASSQWPSICIFGTAVHGPVPLCRMPPLWQWR